MRDGEEDLGKDRDSFDFLCYETAIPELELPDSYDPEIRCARDRARS